MSARLEPSLVLPTLWLLAACPQGTEVVIPQNQAPQVQITTPALALGDDAVAVDGTLGLTAEAVVDDAEDLPESLRVEWSAWPTDQSGDPIVLGEGSADADGYSVQVVGGLEDGAWRLVVRATDTDGATGEAGVPLLVFGADTPPEVLITQPQDGAEGMAGLPQTFSGVASDDRGPEALTAEWSSDLDGLLDTSPPTSTGLLAFTTDELSVGTHTITVRVEDERAQVGRATIEFTVLPLDLPPTTPYVDVQPDVPTTVDDLDCIVLVAASDPEGEPVSYSFAWLRDGQPTIWNDPTLPATETVAGETWRCEVTAHDGAQAGVAGFDEVTVLNTPPTIAHAQITPALPYETSVLSCVGLGWNDPDLDPEGYLVAWTVDGQPAGSAATLDGSSFSRGQQVGCTLTAWDGTSNGTTIVAPTVTIQNSPPSAPGIVLQPQPVATVDAELSCQWTAASVDPDLDPVSYEVEWIIDGLPAPLWAGATVIPAFQAQLGEQWTCRIRGTDGIDPGPWVSASTTVLPEPGDLVITEVHLDPVAVSDVAGEWVELWNQRDFAIDLLGFELHDDGSDSFLVPQSLLVPPQGRVVLARNGDSVSNGGIVGAFEWSGFSVDSVDEVVLSLGGVEVDRVEFDTSLVPGWLAGHSLSLDPALGDPDAAANDAINAWCRSSSPISELTGDFGTPGAANDPCACGLSDGDADDWGVDPTCPLTDCDDADPALSPEAVDICEDGIDQDCTGTDLTCVCADTDDDGDGYGDGLACFPVDCDDANSTVNPGASELCDNADQDCDSIVDEGWDLDSDGFTSCAGDCADLDPARSPTAVEVCDGVDQDCDTVIDDGFDLDLDGFTTCAGDCDDGQPSVHLGATESCDTVDSDCDGSLIDAFPNWDNDGEPDCVDPDDDNDLDPDASDCQPQEPLIYTGAPEACDAVDSDCDGSIVDGAPDTDGDGTPDCIEADDDNDGDPDTTDCNDTDPNVHNGAPEGCDAVDSDCDGSLVDAFPNWDGDAEPDCIDANDDNDPDPDVTDCADDNPSIYTGGPEACDLVDSDCDGSLVDGFTDTDGDAQPDCVDSNDDGDPDPDVTDCNDTVASIYTGAPESCDFVDSDCDGSLVDAFPNWDGDAEPDCVDSNDDNDPDPDVTDCNDGNPAIYTGAAESCDSVDSDCDGSLIDGFSNWDGDSQPDCVDNDDDNDGSADSVDCDDANASIYVGAPESCDLVDSDCDGSLVDGASNWDGDALPDCVDTDDDNDGSLDAADCNDTNSSIYVGAPESCDSVDSDCDGSLVDGFSNWDGDAQPDCVDADDDNDGEADSTDCNDFNPAVSHLDVETCNSVDDDCDGTIDDGFDLDNDGWTTCAGDCADGNAAVHPNQTDTCNGVDTDCDSAVDEDAAGDVYEPNNTLGQAYYVGGDDSTATINATFEYSDDNADWYSIQTTDDTNVVCDTFNITVVMNSIPAGTDYDIYLYRNSSTLLAASEAWGNANESISWSPGCTSWGDDGGAYYVRVSRYSGWSCSDGYHLEISNSN